jgi:hypothetical protein
VSDEPDNDKGYDSDQPDPIIDTSGNLGQATEMFNQALAEEHKDIKTGSFSDISTLFQMALNFAFDRRRKGMLENAQKMYEVITFNSDDYTQVLPSKAIQGLVGVYSDQIRTGTPISGSAKQRPRLVIVYSDQIRTVTPISGSAERMVRLVQLVRTGYRSDAGGMFRDLARALLWLQDDENAVIAYSYSNHRDACFSSRPCNHYKVCRRCARVSMCNFCKQFEWFWDPDNHLGRKIVCDGHDYVDISGAIVDVETELDNVQKDAWLDRLIKKYQA